MAPLRRATEGVPGLRRLVLAAAVLHDIDVQPSDGGVRLMASLEAARRATSIGWDRIASAAGDPADDERQRIDRLAGWLRGRAALLTGAHLHARGLTADDLTSPAAPGPGWIRERVPGGALLLGFGYGADRIPLPDGVLEHAGIDPAIAWRSVRGELEETGGLAARLDRRRRNGPLRPVSGADVVTLLGAAAFRTELARSEGDGLAVLIVPMRVRGWRATTISDPVFGPAMAAATAPHERAFTRPLLVSAHEVNEAAGLRRPQPPRRTTAPGPLPPR